MIATTPPRRIQLIIMVEGTKTIIVSCSSISYFNMIAMEMKLLCISFVFALLKIFGADPTNSNHIFYARIFFVIVHSFFLILILKANFRVNWSKPLAEKQKEPAYKSIRSLTTTLVNINI